MNPIWIAAIHGTLKQATKKCPHCGKRAVYPSKQPGQFYTCKHCRHRFKEKGKEEPR